MASFDTDRAVIEIGGDDRVHFLQGIVTQDVTLLSDKHSLFAALLSPQGKIQHDFFLIKHGDVILLDGSAAQKEMLLKRLAMYKLRAKVNLRDAPEWKTGYRLAATNPTVGHTAHDNGNITVTDPRACELGERIYTQTSAGDLCSTDDYHTHRISLGIPDFSDISDDTALDAGYDLLNAVSFSKGCFVGQEVTARMHYKNIARRGFYTVRSTTPLPAAGTPLLVNGSPIGTLRGAKNGVGLAMVKFEEAEKTLGKQLPVTVDNHSVEIGPAPWLAPKLALFHAQQKKQ